MPETFSYDVFVSHSVQDKTVARAIAERLHRVGIRVWLDEWEIQPGDPIDLKVEQGLQQSRILLLLMSAAAFDSEWAKLERHTALFRDPADERRRFIPIRLDNSEIKETLKQFAYIDWRRKSEQRYTKLITACAPKFRATIDQEDEQATRKVLLGHEGKVWSVAVTPDGRLAVSGSDDKTVRVWEVETGKCLFTFEDETHRVRAVTVTANGRLVVSGAWDRTVRVWEVERGNCSSIFRGHQGVVNSVAVTPDGRLVVSGSYDRTVRVWEVDTGLCLTTLQERAHGVMAVAITADGQRIFSGCRAESTDPQAMPLHMWETETGKLLAELEGHSQGVLSVAITPDGKRVISGSEDRTVRIWDGESLKCMAILEGHTEKVFGVAITTDGKIAVSASWDRTVRVWDVETGNCLDTLGGHTSHIYAVAVTADGRSIVSGSYDRSVRLWEMLSNTERAAKKAAVTKYIRTDLPKEPEPTASEPTRYTNAKVILTGESGVGKTGLAYRLTEGRFRETVSTDALWATQLKLPENLGCGVSEREIWLWDFAGQADYRLIHQLFMDETALAVLVFNPQSENPFEGLGQWDRDLQRAARRSFRKLLVAGRCDRGGLMVSSKSIERFCKDRDFTDFLETSAVTGDGCEALRYAIIRNIAWDDIPWTASPRIFKLLKEEIVRLKDEGKVLLRIAELKQQLEFRLTNESFTLEQLRAVIGLLASPGLVWQLEFGDFVLLHPHRINSYAAAVIRKVRTHTDDIGVISEGDVLAGRLDYQDVKRLPVDEEQIILRAMHQTFVDHGLCLREPTESGTLLIFPSYFKRERPQLEGHPAVFVTYQFNGQLDEIYSTLVVRLHHTPTFEKDQLWRFAADFKTQSGKRVGLKMTKCAEGAAEIAVYFEPDIGEDMKVTFIRYVHEHLQTKAQDVVRLRHYVCPHCHTPVENRRTALERLSEGKKDILCVKCEERVPLWDLIEQKFSSNEFQRSVRALEEQARISIDSESKELILVGHAFAIAGEAGQIYRQYTNSDHGIDGEIEFKDDSGNASGKRLYLQLKSGDSYLQKRKSDGVEIFTIKKDRWADYWKQQAYPVMLVIRTSDGRIRWMNVTDYLLMQKRPRKRITFDGEPFTALSVTRFRDRLFSS